MIGFLVPSPTVLSACYLSAVLDALRPISRSLPAPSDARLLAVLLLTFPELSSPKTPSSACLCTPLGPMRRPTCLTQTGRHVLVYEPVDLLAGGGQEAGAIIQRRSRDGAGCGRSSELMRTSWRRQGRGGQEWLWGRGCGLWMVWGGCARSRARREGPGGRGREEGEERQRP